VALGRLDIHSVPSLGKTTSSLGLSIAQEGAPPFVMHPLWLCKGVPFTINWDKKLWSTKPISMCRQLRHPYWAELAAHVLWWPLQRYDLGD